MLAVPSDGGDPLLGLCRVCAANDEPLTDIFDQHQRLQQKIQVCLRIIVDETDHFPNTLCGPCAARLDVSYELVQRCSRGQQELQRRLEAADVTGTQETGNIDCDDSDSNSSQRPSYATLEPINPGRSDAMEYSASTSATWSGNLGLLADAVEHQSRLEPGTSGYSRGSKELTCEFCNKVFHHTGDLNKHRRSHTGERPYPCSTCEKKFSHISNLLRHTKIHSGERPFKCESCQRSFSRRDKLTSHATNCSRRRSH